MIFDYSIQFQIDRQQMSICIIGRYYLNISQRLQEPGTIRLLYQFCSHSEVRPKRSIPNTLAVGLIRKQKCQQQSQCLVANKRANCLKKLYSFCKRGKLSCPLIVKLWTFSKNTRCTYVVGFKIQCLYLNLCLGKNRQVPHLGLNLWLYVRSLS